MEVFLNLRKENLNTEYLEMSGTWNRLPKWHVTCSVQGPEPGGIQAPQLGTLTRKRAKGI